MRDSLPGRDKKILITGATGFLGRFLVDELVSKGYTDLTALARKTSDVSLLKEKKVGIIYADITDRPSLDAVRGSWDAVFHCAGFVGNDARALERVNVLGTKNICRFALERGVKKFLYTSSVAVNSGNTEIPLREDLPYKPTNKYGVSKMEAEKIAVGFRDKGLPMVILRPCMVYGEGEPHQMPFLAKLARSRLFVIPYFAADVRLHLVSARNVAACFVSCMEDSRAEGEVFNIADEEVLTLRQLFEIAAGELGVNRSFILPRMLTGTLMSMPVIGQYIRFLSKDRVYDIGRLKAVIGFTPPYKAASEFAGAIRSSAIFTACPKGFFL